MNNKKAVRRNLELARLYAAGQPRLESRGTKKLTHKAPTNVYKTSPLVKELFFSLAFTGILIAAQFVIRYSIMP